MIIIIIMMMMVNQFYQPISIDRPPPLSLLNQIFESRSDIEPFLSTSRKSISI